MAAQQDAEAVQGLRLQHRKKTAVIHHPLRVPAAQPEAAESGPDVALRKLPVHTGAGTEKTVVPQADQHIGKIQNAAEDMQTLRLHLLQNIPQRIGGNQGQEIHIYILRDIAVQGIVAGRHQLHFNTSQTDRQFPGKGQFFIHSVHLRRIQIHKFCKI